MDLPLLIVPNALGLAALLFLFLFVFQESELNKRSLSIFREAAVCDFCLIVLDLVEYILEFQSFPGSEILRYVVIGLCYGFNPLVLMAISRFYFSGKRFYYFRLTASSLNIIVCLIFSTLSGVYKNQDAAKALLFKQIGHYWMLVTVSIFIVMASLSLFLGDLRNQRKSAYALYTFAIASLVASFVLEINIHDIRFAVWNLMAIVLVVLYLYANNTLLHHDPLTGFLTRFYFEKDLSSHNSDLTVFIFDINNLKTVNDTSGHQAGDELITSVSDGLKEAFKNYTGKFYRIGGDEFVFIANGLIGTDDAARVLEKLSTILPNDMVAFGYAAGEEGVANPETFKLADNRMYQKKSEQKALQKPLKKQL